jgi:hypothetical protein
MVFVFISYNILNTFGRLDQINELTLHFLLEIFNCFVYPIGRNDLMVIW